MAVNKLSASGELGISTFNILKMSSDKKVVVDEQAISRWFD